MSPVPVPDDAEQLLGEAARQDTRWDADVEPTQPRPSHAPRPSHGPETRVNQAPRPSHASLSRRRRAYSAPMKAIGSATVVGYHTQAQPTG